MRISDWSSDVCSSDLGRRDDEVLAIDFLLRRGTDDPVLNGAIETGQRDEPVVEIIFRRRIETVGFLRFQIGIALAPIVDPDRVADIVQLAHSSEERRVGKECVSTCRSWWSPYH